MSTRPNFPMGVKLVFCLLILTIMSSSVLAATKAINGTLYQSDNTTPAGNASVVVYVTVSVVGTPYQCQTNPAVIVNGTSGQWVSNLGNLKFSSNLTNGCSSNWATGNPIWAIANGANVTPEHGNATVANTTIESGTGPQSVGIASLPPGPDRIAPIIHLITPTNYTNDTDGSVSFEFNVTDNSTISNCSLLFNAATNTTSSSVTTNITQTFNLTNMADGLYNWSVGCYDNASNYNTSIETWLLNVSKIGHYNISLITPSANGNVQQNQYFPFTIQITCLGGTCGDTNASLDPIIISNSNTNQESNQSIFSRIWQAITNFFTGNLITGQVTGALVPTTPTTPFYTNTSNPLAPGDVACLSNMLVNTACNVTWYVNATGDVGTTAEFWAFANSTTYENVNNETSHIFLTIIELIPPTILAYTPNGETFDIETALEISINTTDAQGISTVKANVTYPNTTVQQITLTNVPTTDKYNSSFSIPALVGTYNIRFIVNDTGNNINSTVTTTFIGRDIIPPNVTALIPTNQTTYNAGQTIQIASNVTDQINISRVTANITYPNSSTTVINLTKQGASSKYNGSFAIPQQLGTYSVQFIANDTQNNINNTETTTFIVVDGTNPSLSTLREFPTDPATYALNQNYFFNVTVTDNIGINNVFIEFGGQVYMDNVTNSGSTYFFNRTNLAVGVYDYAWYANDTSGNINALPSNYTVNRATSVVNLTLAGTDGDISIPAHTQINLSGTRIAGEGTIELLENGTLISSGTTFTSLNRTYDTKGTYNLTLRHNQTGNFTLSQETHIISVTDGTPPSVYALIPQANTTFNTSQTIQIAANVTDDTTVNKVTATITYPNSTTQTINLTQQGITEKYNSTFTIPQQIGTYTVQYWANDSQNNINNTETSSFIVQDVTTPSLSTLTEYPADPATYAQNQDYFFNVTITDNVAINNVIIEFDGVNYSSEITNSGSKYKFNRTNLPVGVYNYTWYANDTSGNINSLSSNYTINRAASSLSLTLDGNNSDITKSVGSSVDIIGTRLQGEGPIELLSNGTVLSTETNTIDLTLGFAVPNNYSLTLRHNQTENYSESSVTYIVFITDNTNPTVTDVTANSVNQTQNVTINATITDNIAVASAIAQIRYPNNTTQNLTMDNTDSHYYTTYQTNLSSPIGNHTVQIIAYDSSNNVNSTQNTTFMVYDITPPNVTSIIPTNGSTKYTETTIELAANVADNIEVSTVFANMTYPNASSTIVELSQATGTKYNSSFDLTTQNGTYTIQIIANDTSNNLNSTQTTAFFVNLSDFPPEIILSYPANAYSATTTNQTELNFTCNITDDHALVNLSLYLTNNVSTNFTLNQTINITGTQNSTTWPLNLTKGTYTWNCEGFDNSSQSGWGINRTITLTTPSSSGGGTSSSSSSSSGGPTGPPSNRPEVPTCRWNESVVEGECLYNESKGQLNAVPTTLQQEPGQSNLIGHAFDINMLPFNIDLSLVYIAAVVFFLGLFALLLWTRKRPYIIISAPRYAGSNQTFNLRVKVGNDQRPVVVRLWSIFVPEGEVGLLNIKNIISNGPTYRLDVDREETRRGTIPVTIPASCKSGKYRVITCARWEYKTLAENKQTISSAPGKSSLPTENQNDDKIKVTAHQNKLTITKIKIPLPPELLVLVGKRSRLPENIAVNLQTMRDKLASSSNNVELIRTRAEILLRMRQAEKMHKLRLQKMAIDEEMRHTEENGVLQLELTRLGQNSTNSRIPTPRSKK